MSDIGFNGRDFTILLNGTKIAALQSKTFTFAREAVDTTNDDSDGYRILLADPGVRSIDCSAEGVATDDNFELMLTEWAGSANSAITLQAPNGQTITAEYGFFLGNLEMTGAHDGYVAFTASLQSSGPITITPAP